MSPEERSLVLALAVVPGKAGPLPQNEFLQKFGATDGIALGRDLLSDAVARRDPVDVELSLMVGFTFGFSLNYLQALITLAFADWHEKHEDVTRALGTLRSPESVLALLHLAEWVPPYLEFDDARALAVKAVWALSGIRGEAARTALESLTHSNSDIVAKTAVARLQR